MDILEKKKKRIQYIYLLSKKKEEERRQTIIIIHRLLTSSFFSLPRDDDNVTARDSFANFIIHIYIHTYKCTLDRYNQGRFHIVQRQRTYTVCTQLHIRPLYV